MKIKVCPVCDREMKGRFFCRHCKTFVRHPNYWDQSYELNSDHNVDIKANECRDHNHSRENKTGKIEKNYNQAYQKSQSLGKANENLNTNTKTDSGSKKQSSGSAWKVIIIVIGAVVFINIFIAAASIFFSVKKGAGNSFGFSIQLGKGKKEKTPETDGNLRGGNEDAVWYTDYVTEDMKMDTNVEDDYIVTTYEMDLDTISEIGLPCNSYEHYEAKIKDVKKSIKKYLKENMPSKEPEYSEYSNNVLIVYENYSKDEKTETTNFNTYCEWQLDDDYNDLIRITYDSVTKNISYIFVYNEDKAVCQDTARFIMGLVDKETDSSEWEKILDEEESGSISYENTYISWEFSEDTGNIIYLSPVSDCFEQGK